MKFVHTLTVTWRQLDIIIYISESILMSLQKRLCFDHWKFYLVRKHELKIRDINVNSLCVNILLGARREYIFL